MNGARDICSQQGLEIKQRIRTSFGQANPMPGRHCSNEEKDSIEEIHSLLQYCMETLEHSESSVIFRNLAVIFQLEFRYWSVR
ncbi:hypothetical protein TWF225_001888 [Orbilia oligospora]|nr:hypothetical protein TWF225_001888 [Orbilia oligospora]KAF3262233.1 hypothetical protein TWF217_004300 [Orbilia oligospora]